MIKIVIHEHVNEQGMSRITIIIIWLIVIACLVAVGEVRDENFYKPSKLNQIPTGRSKTNATRIKTTIKNHTRKSNRRNNIIHK